MSDREHGQIIHWNNSRKFGFIRTDSAGGPDVFMHLRGCEYPEEMEPALSDRVSFDVEFDKRAGKQHAVRVRLDGHEEEGAQAAQKNVPAGLFKAPIEDTVSGAALADWLTRDQQ